MVLRDVVSRGHADGRKRYSETDRSKKKNICGMLETEIPHATTRPNGGQ